VETEGSHLSLSVRASGRPGRQLPYCLSLGFKGPGSASVSSVDG
jgi:hypothetical protein